MARPRRGEQRRVGRAGMRRAHSSGIARRRRGYHRRPLCVRFGWHRRVALPRRGGQCGRGRRGLSSHVSDCFGVEIAGPYAGQHAPRVGNKKTRIARVEAKRPGAAAGCGKGGEATGIVSLPAALYPTQSVKPSNHLYGSLPARGGTCKLVGKSARMASKFTRKADRS